MTQHSAISRRNFVAIVGGATVAWPVLACARVQPMPVVGWLSGVSQSAIPAFPFFLRGLGELGYVEGRDFTIEARFAEFHNERLPALALELVQSRVTLIAATSGLPSVLAAKTATTTIPIVFIIPGDPVQLGLVASLNRPSGNLTGVTAMVGLMKQIEILNELLLPNKGPFAVLVDPSTEAEIMEANAESAGRTVGRRIVFAYAAGDGEFETAIAKIIGEQAAGLVVAPQPLFISQQNQLAARIARHSIAAIYPPGDLAASGGLISYGAPIFEMFRQAGHYAGKILGGAKPAELPVEQPTKFELVINLKTANVLGLAVPPTLLSLADKVIE
jgi:putative ABC transport system substrate-binding protein